MPSSEKRNPGWRAGASRRMPDGLALFEYIADLIHVAAWVLVVIWLAGGGAP